MAAAVMAAVVAKVAEAAMAAVATAAAVTAVAATAAVVTAVAAMVVVVTAVAAMVAVATAVAVVVKAAATAVAAPALILIVDRNTPIACSDPSCSTKYRRRRDPGFDNSCDYPRRIRCPACSCRVRAAIGDATPDTCVR